jgi:NitT/TauT family transport system ATP-binding protein
MASTSRFGPAGEYCGYYSAITRDEMGLELLRIWHERRKTVVFVTHSISEAVFLSDRVVVMTPRPGRVAEVLAIDLPRPRTMGVRALPRFGEYEVRVRERIFEHDHG